MIFLWFFHVFFIKDWYFFYTINAMFLIFTVAFLVIVSVVWIQNLIWGMEGYFL